MAHLQRLAEERKNWRKNRPFGFVAKPRTKADGSVDLTIWDCKVPGVEGTPWENGHYPVTLTFGNDYPTKAPTAKLPAGFFHVNVYPEGWVCLSILNDDDELGGQWKPSIGLKDILIGIQTLLNEPNIYSPANSEAEKVYKNSKSDYEKKVRKQAQQYKQADED